MKSLILCVLALFLTTAVAFAKDYEMTKKAGEYDVTLNINKNPPVVGDNGFTITVKDASGKAVANAVVVIDYSMPAMSGMPAMSYKADASLKGDAYAGNMNLSMSGAWTVAIKITQAGKTSTAKFNVEAH